MRSKFPFAALSRLLLLTLGAILLSCVPLTRPAAPPAQATPRLAGTAGRWFTHAFIVVEENHEYDQIIGSPDAPYINKLASQYGLATNYYAVTHPSLPNYLALISGSTQGITNDCPDCSVNAPNLVDELARRGISWKAYLESMPRPCYNYGNAGSPLDAMSGDFYVRRHDPFLYFQDISSNPSRCDRVVPFEQLATDLHNNAVPDFVWITPNLANDMHNGSVKAGDDWLAAQVPAILRSAAWRDNGVLFITWDEGTTNAGCCGVSGGGRVPLLVITPNQGPRRSSTPYTHYSLLRTLEESWGLALLGHSGDADTRPVLDLLGRASGG
ncbi:MAG TPA: alkaline phosphatase family protein [Chloroflexota bacterium]|nr:alkaline phosphatase family protein [Chloroflexota bacterium]